MDSVGDSMSGSGTGAYSLAEPVSWRESQGGGWGQACGSSALFLTARSPLLRSREADLVDRLAYPLGEGGPTFGQPPLCL